MTQPMSDEPPPRLPSNANQARQWIDEMKAELSAHGISMREPPEEPTSCCGRGCVGCVWEGYMNAVAYWCEQARVVLLKNQATGWH